MPAWADTSVNSTGPDGRGGVGLGDGDGAWFEISTTGAAGAVGAGCLQAETIRKLKRQKISKHRLIYKFVFLSEIFVTPSFSFSPGFNRVTDGAFASQPF